MWHTWVLIVVAPHTRYQNERVQNERAETATHDPAQVTLGAASFAAVVPLPGAFCHSYAERASQQLFGSCPGARARVLLPVPGRRPPSG